MKSLSVYLAGPEVFLPEAKALGAAKCALCAAAGLRGLFPLDGTLDLRGLEPRLQGRAIYRADLAMMREADLIIANLTPFRGVSADVGTAFEVGFMAALGKPVLAYSNSAKSFAGRLADLHPGGLRPRADGMLASPDGLMVEAFDMLDNLMLGGAVAEGDLFLHQAAPGAELTDLTAFRDAVAAARRLMSP